MSDYLIHHGIKGQKWGVRRFQNTDGSRTAAGKKHESENRAVLRGVRKAFDKSWSAYKETVKPGTLESTLVDSPAREKAIRILQDDKNFQKALVPIVERAKAVQQKYKGKMPKDIDWNEHSRELYDIDRAVGELSVKAGIVKAKGPGDPEEFDRWAYIGFVAARELDEVTGDPGIGDALIHGETKNMYPNQHNYLIHWLKKGEKAKYVDKIKLANGRWRYFYSQAELEAYKLKQRLSSKANELKKKAYDNLGGKEKDEFMREWNRGNELYLQGKEKAANKAYDKAIAARDRYWKTPIGATLHAATTVKESVDDFLYDTGLSEKAPQYIAKAKKLLRGIGEGAKNAGAKTLVKGKGNAAALEEKRRQARIHAGNIMNVNAIRRYRNEAGRDARRKKAATEAAGKATYALKRAANNLKEDASALPARATVAASKVSSKAREYFGGGHKEKAEAARKAGNGNEANQEMARHRQSALGKAEERLRISKKRKATNEKRNQYVDKATRTHAANRARAMQSKNPKNNLLADAKGDLERMKAQREKARRQGQYDPLYVNSDAEIVPAGHPDNWFFGQNDNRTYENGRRASKRKGKSK